VVALDADWRPAFRVAAYEGYKSERPDDPPELPWQFELLDEVLTAAGISQASVEGLEADDAIATLVERAPADRMTYIVSGDRDMIALVKDPTVRLLFPVKGVREMTDMDEAAVEAKYGIPPRLYPEFAMMRGDPSDGLPGVAGIGQVRAAKLLQQYGSLDGVLEHVDELPKRQAYAFNEAREYLETMRTVVLLVRDADVDLSEPRPPDETALRTLGEKHNLGSSVGRLLQALAPMWA
jgi:5'-3' exonuclease